MKDDIDFNVKFIKLIQERPCLYDYNRPDYCNRHSQNTAWEEIEKNIKEPVADCKERWKNLRGCYTRHLKKISSSSGRWVKPYYLAENLRFLDGFTKTRRQNGGFKECVFLPEEDNETDADDSSVDTKIIKTSPNLTIFDKQYFDQSRPESVKPNQNTEPCKEVPQKNELPLPYLPSRCSHERDPDLAFFYSLLPDMKEMSREQIRRFKMGVLNLAGNILRENENVEVYTPISQSP